MKQLSPYITNRSILCMLMLSLASINSQAQNKEKFLDTLNIKEIEMGSSIDYIRFSKNTKIEATDFIKNNPKLFYETSNQKMVLKKTEEDELGFTHYRYGQTYMGIAIEDADYWIHSKDGVLITANGLLLEIKNTKYSVMNIDSLEAIQITDTFIKSMKFRLKGKFSYPHTAELFWVSSDKDTTEANKKNKYLLAWKVSSPDYSRVTYVSAVSGTIVGAYSNVVNCSPTTFSSLYYGNKNITTKFENNEYIMHDLCASSCMNTNKNIRVEEILGSFDVLKSTNNTWTTDVQRMGATVLWCLGNAFNYFCSNHQWSSYNGQGGSILASVIDAQTGGNASYGIGGYMTFESQFFCTQDIAAHEFAHGVVNSASGISASGGACGQDGCEKDAINESIADMFATATEFYTFTSGNDYLIGEDVTGGTGIRNMGNPKSFNYPNCYPTTAYPNPQYWVGDKYPRGAVSSFWFYLLCQGGSGNVDNNLARPVYTISAIGMDKVTRIVMRALRYYMHLNTTFKDFRRTTIEAAKDLYGNCSNESIQVAKAWGAVGAEEVNVVAAFPLCGDINSQSSPLNVYYATTSLQVPTSSCSNVTVKSANSLFITSSQSIVLKPGFRAEAGSRFKASIDPCVSQTIRKAYANQELNTNVVKINKAKLIAYPNPTHDNLYIDISEDLGKVGKIDLYNTMGTILPTSIPYTINDKNQIQADVSTINSGIYMLHISFQDSKEICKVVIH